MKEDILKPVKKMLTIGKYKINISHITFGRQLEASDMLMSLESTKLTSHYEAASRTFEAILTLIRIDFSVKRFKDWFVRRFLISKKYLFKNLSYKEATDFVEEALEPIIGSKKKELNKKERITEMGLKIGEILGPEQSAKLLQLFALSTDGQKSMF